MNELNQFMKYISIIFALILSSCSLNIDEATLKDKKFLNLLKHHLTDIDYLNIVNSSEEYDIESIGQRNGYFIYKFATFDPGLNEHNFIFVVNKDFTDVFLLTESIDNYNKYIFPEYKNSLSQKKVEQIIIESSLFTRAFYEHFVLLDSLDVAEEWLAEESLSLLSQKDYKLACSLGDKEYKCQVPLIIAQDLFLRSAIVEHDKVIFNDELIKREASKFLSPHY